MMKLPVMPHGAGRMHGAPSAWLSYAVALYQLHQGNAKLQAQQALEQGMSDSPAPQVVDYDLHRSLHATCIHIREQSCQVC